MMLEIDLNAPSISEKLRVWRMFPGQSYQFINDFQKQNIGFLNLPAFPMPENKLSDATDIFDRIAFSRKYGELLRAQNYEEADNLQLSQFKNSIQTNARGRLRQSIINFYEKANEGDLVILPEPVHLSRVWIGRFNSNSVNFGTHERGYGDASIPARSISWLGSYQENTISSALSETLRNQHPFTLIPKSLFVEVFALAFSSFVYGQTHVATIYNGDDFLDADAALMGMVSRLASAACQAIDQHQEKLGTDAILDILFSNPNIEYTSTQQSDIHSRGFTRYISGSVVSLATVSIISILIDLSSNSSKANLTNDIETTSVINTDPNADPICTAKVSEAAKRVLVELGIDNTWRLCQATRAAKDRAGLRPSAQPSKR